jgi:hypothetical protein
MVVLWGSCQKRHVAVMSDRQERGRCKVQDCEKYCRDMIGYGNDLVKENDGIF